ncbi:hypothetical protein SAMN03159406_04509 [Rhizobium sp. NFR03]|nr:hypothetical protein SAMN03159406_04509 [Rhizobium sp. NFR03]
MPAETFPEFSYSNAPTAVLGTNTTQIATMAAVKAAFDITDGGSI